MFIKEETDRYLIYPFREMVHVVGHDQPRIAVTKPKNKLQIAGIVFLDLALASWNKNAAREISQALQKAIEIAEDIDWGREVKL